MLAMYRKLARMIVLMYYSFDSNLSTEPLADNRAGRTRTIVLSRDTRMGF